MSSQYTKNMENPMLADLPANRSRSLAAMKQKDKQTSVPTSLKRPSYDWAGNLEISEEEAEADGIVELPVLDVGNVIEGGKINANVHSLPLRTRKNFIIYNGTDVVACVEDRLKSYGIVHKLAKLHIGRVQHSLSPDHVGLDVEYKNITRARDEQCWVIYFHPKADSSAKRVKA